MYVDQQTDRQTELYLEGCVLLNTIWFMYAADA